MAVTKIFPQRKRINPIPPGDPIGNGLQDKASDALAAHRERGISQGRVIRNPKMGTNLGGAPAIR